MVTITSKLETLMWLTKNNWQRSLTISQQQVSFASIPLAPGSVQLSHLLMHCIKKRKSIPAIKASQYHPRLSLSHKWKRFLFCFSAVAMGQCERSVSLRGTTECVNRCIWLNQPCTANVLKRVILKCKWGTKGSKRRTDHLGVKSEKQQSVLKMDLTKKMHTTVCFGVRI